MKKLQNQKDQVCNKTIIGALIAFCAFIFYYISLKIGLDKTHSSKIFTWSCMFAFSYLSFSTARLETSPLKALILNLIGSFFSLVLACYIFNHLFDELILLDKIYVPTILTPFVIVIIYAFTRRN